MIRRHRRLALVAVPLAVLSLAACGDDDDGGSTDAPAEGGLVAVGLDGLRWDRDAYTATAGDVEVTLGNKSSQPHTLVILDAAGTQVGPTLESSGEGDTATATVNLAAGSYTIICTVPGHGAMKADLTVS